MPSVENLLRRLDEIGQSLARSDNALALIGLGSVGIELNRIDRYSDLDFFVITRPGSKQDYLTDLSWLSTPCPIAYQFRNTVDGFKVLYEDGIFAEFAVFESQELAGIPFAPGRLVWAAEGVDKSIAVPQQKVPESEVHPREWLVGEALTNLYIGMGRYLRGEKLSALRFIQGYAVDRLVQLTGLREAEQPALQDPFTPERRFEQRYPSLVERIPEWTQGYHATPQSARSILQYLDENFDVTVPMKEKILALIEEAQAQ